MSSNGFAWITTDVMFISDEQLKSELAKIAASYPLKAFPSDLEKNSGFDRTEQILALAIDRYRRKGSEL